MANTIYATLLGGFSLAWPERDGPEAATDQESPRELVWTFLEYLTIHHRKPVEEAEMIRAIWGSERVVDAAGTLKALLARGRNILEELGFPNGASVLHNRRGCYSWAPGIELELDTEELDLLCADFVLDREKTLPKVLEALPRFQGDFLPNAGKRPWAAALRKHYRSRYLQLLRGAAELLSEQERNDEAIRLCRMAVAVDPFDEWSQITLMRLLHATGSTQSALWHYKTVSRLFMDQLGAEPSGKMLACYQEISRSGKTEEPDLQSIRDELEAGDNLARPLYCDYNVFQTVYRLMARSMNRNGTIAQLALLTVLEQNGTPLSEARCGAAMEALRSTGLTGLREGDVATQPRPNQYLLLLPSATQEDAQMTLTRCLTAFEKTIIGQTVSVHTGVQPVRPIEL